MSEANPAGKTYGEADPELTATVTGLIGEDTVKYTVTRAAGEDAGEYAVTAAGENARLNGVANAEYFCGDAATAFERFSAKEKAFSRFFSVSPIYLSTILDILTW